jgi:hypothetical protein
MGRGWESFVFIVRGQKINDIIVERVIAMGIGKHAWVHFNAMMAALNVSWEIFNFDFVI